MELIYKIETRTGAYIYTSEKNKALNYFADGLKVYMSEPCALKEVSVYELDYIEIEPVFVPKGVSA